MNPVQVSIVIVNYRTPEFVVQAVRSLRRHATDVAWEVILVDSASQDQSIPIFRESCPEAKVIEMPANLGFGAACNRGASEARGAYLAFLNSDAYLVEPLFSKLLQLDAKRDSGCVWAVGVQGPDGQRQVVTGRWPSLWRAFLNVLGTENQESQRDLQAQEPIHPTDGDAGLSVDWVNGTFLWMRRGIFQELNGFDPSIFMYGEDVELCWRARKAGYERRYYGKLFIHHLGGGSQKKGSLTSLRLTDGGRIRAAYLMRGRGYAMGFRLVYGIRSGIRFLLFGLVGMALLRKTWMQRSWMHGRRCLELAVGG
jgi:GT2 family glycosyltransferase